MRVQFKAKKKPPVSVIRDKCMCTHSLDLHENGECQACDCKHYHLRPCVCGHARNLHRGRCTDKTCHCESFRMDDTPQQLLQMGIRAGEWQYISRPILQGLQRPGNPVEVRVYATGLLYTHGKSRLAEKMARGKDGKPIFVNSKLKLVPLQQDDILQELNAMERFPRLDRHAVRKAVRRLEQQGKCRYVAGHRKNTAMYFYYRPLAKRTLPDLPDLSPKILGVKSDPQMFASDSFEKYLQDTIILPARKIIVKLFSKALRERLQPNFLGVKSDPQKLMEEAIEEAVLGVKSAYIKIELGVKSDPQDEALYRKASNSSRTSSSEAAADQARGNDDDDFPPPPPRETDWIREALAVWLPDDASIGDKLIALLTGACRGKMPDITAGEICDAIAAVGKLARGSNVKNPLGYLLKIVPDSISPVDIRNRRDGKRKSDDADLQQALKHHAESPFTAEELSSLAANHKSATVRKWAASQMGGGQ